VKTFIHKMKIDFVPILLLLDQSNQIMQ